MSFVSANTLSRRGGGEWRFCAEKRGADFTPRCCSKINNRKQKSLVFFPLNNPICKVCKLNGFSLTGLEVVCTLTS